MVLIVGDADRNNILIPKKISSSQKNYKVKPFSIILSKTSAYKNVMMVKLNECIFDWRWWIIEDIMKFGTETAISNSMKKNW